VADGGSAGTPAPILDKLHAWFTEIVNSQDTREFLARNGGEPYTNASPAATKKLVEQELAAWKDYIAVAKIEAQ